MFTAVVLSAAIAVALVRGGKLSNLIELHLRAWWLLLAGFGLQIAANLVGGDAKTTAVAMLYASYVALLAVVWLNRGEPGMWIAGVGVLMNFTVIAANGGMPVLPAAIEIAGGDPTVTDLGAKHVILTVETRLAFLADVIPFPGQVISLGDVFLAIGLGVFLEDKLRRPPRLFRHGIHGEPGSAAER